MEQRTGILATNTPSWLAKDMVALANLSIFDKVLEPSAGTGNILKEIVKDTFRSSTVTAYELNKDNFNYLKNTYETKVYLHNKDFLGKDSVNEFFSKVIMNPPHKGCVDHIRKAYSHLRQGGTIVALVHWHYVDEIKEFIPNLRCYTLPFETFVLPSGENIEASIIVGDKS